MKALIIGGTKGFGREILEQLVARGYNAITISRSKTRYQNHPHYSCDVGNVTAFAKILRKIEVQHKKIDFLACVVGFAKAKSFKNLNIEDWNQHYLKNVVYVALTLQKLGDLLNRSKNPKGFTIGSQWSYKTGNENLVPYTVAKHALRALTEDFARRNPRIKINHYCTPTMGTPGYWKVRKSFQTIGEESVIKNFTPKGLANPKDVAKAVIDDIVKTDLSGATLVVKSGGKIEIL